MNAGKQRWTFISYSRKDKGFALQLARELKSAGFLVWLDQLDIATGTRWDDEVERALRECEIFLIILTPASTSSENVKDEIGYAIDHGKRILPVLLEECDVPLRLRRFQYVDFTKMDFSGGVERAKQLLDNLINERSTPVSPTNPKLEVQTTPRTETIPFRRRWIFAGVGILALCALLGAIAAILIIRDPIPPSDTTSQQLTETVLTELAAPARISPTIEPTQQATVAFTPDSPVPPTPVPPTSIPASPTPSTVELPFMGDESGWVTQGGQVGTGSEHPPQAGDFNNNEVVRGFLSFDLNSIPGNATIQSARLVLPESAQGSGDVFPNFGSLTFEAVWYGLSLNPQAFDSPGYLVLQNAYGPTSVIGVTAGIENAIQQGYRRFQIRFSFSAGTDNDNSGENYWIPDPPNLEVVYIVP